MSVFTVPVFPFLPDWGTPVEETRSWLTDVYEAEDGTETRIAMRESPRVTLAFSLTFLEEQELQTFDRLVWARGSEVFAIPNWCSKSLLLTNAAADDTTVYCDTTDRDFTAFATGFGFGGAGNVDAAAILIRDYQTYEVVSVNGVFADHITLSDGLADPWTAGQVLVLPLITGRLAKEWRLTRPTSALGVLPIMLEMETIELPGIEVIR